MGRQRFTCLIITIAIIALGSTTALAGTDVKLVKVTNGKPPVATPKPTKPKPRG